MTTSAEIRWFFQGIIHNDILLFFKENQIVFQEEPPRTDWYLLNNDNFTSVKLRNHSLEIKRFLGKHENFRINSEIRGNAEKWVKFSFEMKPGDDSRDITTGRYAQWLAVEKKRSVVRYAVLNDGDIRVGTEDEPEGGTLEICFVKTLKRDFWTVGIETSGPEEKAVMNLEQIANHLFRNSMQISLFKNENSYSYPEFLGKLSLL